MISLAAHGRSIRAEETLVEITRNIHKNICTAKCWEETVQICFANASLSLSPPPRLTTGTVERRASLLVLLTGILCVDECAGLTAQCAYLIGAALLSR